MYSLVKSLNLCSKASTISRKKVEINITVCLLLLNFMVAFIMTRPMVEKKVLKIRVFNESSSPYLGVFVDV